VSAGSHSHTLTAPRPSAKLDFGEVQKVVDQPHRDTSRAPLSPSSTISDVPPPFNRHGGVVPCYSIGLSSFAVGQGQDLCGVYFQRWDPAIPSFSRARSQLTVLLCRVCQDSSWSSNRQVGHSVQLCVS
jgi:hypothetical protein